MEVVNKGYNLEFKKLQAPILQFLFVNQKTVYFVELYNYFILFIFNRILQKNMIQLLYIVIHLQLVFTISLLFIVETSSIEIGNVYDTIDDYNLSYQNLVSEYNMIENEIERLKERIPDIEEKAKKRREKLRNYTWKDYKFKSTQKIQEEKNQSSSRQLSDFEDWDTNMY